ncbi:MAG: rhodanese-like domain-containing protein [Candidatus Omnitrophica bacterium]|nr:rhodanese-like domain-containing protein [Candidatus Omnitrophota bacterium]
MRKTLILVFAIILLSFLIAPSLFAHCGVCGVGKEKEHEAKGSTEKTTGSCFGDVCAATSEKGGVREITYEQFQKIRNSGEKYVLVDALSKESYDKGHIEGAISFPYKRIDYETAPNILSKADNIIVYCGSFECAASTKAAHRLQALGYENVIDYKGGLKEWQEKGNELVQ